MRMTILPCLILRNLICLCLRTVKSIQKYSGSRQLMRILGKMHELNTRSCLEIIKHLAYFLMVIFI